MSKEATTTKTATAPQTAMAAEAAAEVAAALALAQEKYIASSEEWEQINEPEFGGQSEILELNVGQVAGPLTYIGHQAMTTSLGETTVHTATTREETTVRLPIGATFNRAMDQAGVRRGDKFFIKRTEDAIKKQGKGKGNPMKIYAIKVSQRAVPSQFGDQQ